MPIIDDKLEFNLPSKAILTYYTIGDKSRFIRINNVFKNVCIIEEILQFVFL